MSARDTIAESLHERDILSIVACRRYADYIISDPTAAGFSIVHKDEIHAPSVERAIAVAEAERKRHDFGDGFDSYPAHQAAFDIKAAIRELMKEVGRG